VRWEEGDFTCYVRREGGRKIEANWLQDGLEHEYAEAFPRGRPEERGGENREKTDRRQNSHRETSEEQETQQLRVGKKTKNALGNSREKLRDGEALSTRGRAWAHLHRKKLIGGQRGGENKKNALKKMGRLLLRKDF